MSPNTPPPSTSETSPGALGAIPAAPLADAQAQQIKVGNYGGGLDWAFDAARSSGYRGYFWFPQLDPAKQITQWSRTQTARKINWLYNNIGAVRAVIDGLAMDEVDTGLWPKPFSSSRAFNAKVKQLFHQQCGFHKAFSSNGENNFFSAQLLIRREIRLRGDFFAQKLRVGEAASCPQIHFLPGWQCDSSTGFQPGWVDGRLNNPLGRAVAYRFLVGGDRNNTQDVAAQDIMHFHDPFLEGQQRGMPDLAPVVRKLYTLDDIERTESNGVLLRSRVAYAIERAENDANSGPTLIPGAEVEVVKQPDGSQLFVQKLLAGPNGQQVDVAELPAGKKIKVVESQKASESSSWIKELLADVAYCTKYPPSYIFSLAELQQGTLVRLTQQRVQRVLNTVRDFQLIMQFLEEWWPFWLWQNIQAGNLDDVNGGIPDDWYKYIVIRPKDLTVDQGREGRLYDERVATGKMPVGLYVGMLYGEDDEEFDDEIIRDAYRRRQRNEEIAAEFKVPPIPIDQIFRLPTGSTAPQGNSSTQGDPEETPSGKPTTEEE